MIRSVIRLLVYAFILASCQKINLDEEEGHVVLSMQTDGDVRPVGLGEGTAQRPYTVDDVLDGNVPDDTTVWVIGYAVGAAYNTVSNAVFSPATTYETSILLSADSLCGDVDECVPVELKSAAARRNFSIPADRSRFRQCVMLLAEPSTYYKRNGLRNVSTGHWLYGFDISSLSSEPEEWGEIVISSPGLR